MSLYNLNEETQRRGLFHMKIYLNDDKTHVDPRPHNDILLGLNAHCGSQGFKISELYISVHCDNAVL